MNPNILFALLIVYAPENIDSDLYVPLGPFQTELTSSIFVVHLSCSNWL